jgi:peptide/nickel transport system substrate-binding protein
MRKILISALAGVASLALMGAAQAQELVVGVQNMSAALDPGRDHSNVGSQHYYNTFDTLIEKDHAKSEPVWKPGLATSWKLISPTVMEFKIRQGVKFHNGAAMTAEDVKYSIDRIINTTFPPYLIRKKDFLPNIEKVDVVDAETIRVTAYRPEPLFETLFNIQQTNIVPKAYMMALTGDPMKDEPSDYEAFGLKPVGTGPYKVTEFVPNQRIVYERFDDFWGDKAPFKKVTVRRIAELSARITALKNNEVEGGRQRHPAVPRGHLQHPASEDEPGAAPGHEPRGRSQDAERGAVAEQGRRAFHPQLSAVRRALHAGAEDLRI